MVTTPKQQFIKFLKQNNVYEQYMHNFIKREEKRNKLCPKNQFFSKTEPEEYINKAFRYDLTKEGWLYWFKLSVEWRRYYIKNDNLKVL